MKLKQGMELSDHKCMCIAWLQRQHYTCRWRTAWLPQLRAVEEGPQVLQRQPRIGDGS